MDMNRDKSHSLRELYNETVNSLIILHFSNQHAS